MLTFLLMVLDILTLSMINYYSMNYDQIIEHYGSAEKAGAALGLTRQGVFRWKSCPIPLEKQVEIEVDTQGALRAELPEFIRKQAA